WTGSCPCQPFSSAGKRQGERDKRHLWPEFYRLIAECNPPVVFGEQVASPLGRKWLTGVRADLEALGYAVGPPICALRASARRISGRGFSGWPTPRAADISNESWETKQARNARHLAEGRNQMKGVGGMTLPTAAQQVIAGWPTPRANDGTGDKIPPGRQDVGIFWL